jgi:pyrroloquinoline quinone (PQQ) biosynthesis protein C
MIEKLEQHVRSDGAWAELERFGEGLKARPLDRQLLRVFLASTSEFFKEIPGGILALALRVTDDWMERDRFSAVAKAANVLYSAVDEYGLHETHKGVQKGHHELFRDMAHQWGVSTKDLLDPTYVLPEAVDLGRVTRDYYRSRHVAAGLGFHFASEKTSDREFQLCMQGFTTHWKSYSLTDANDPTLAFYYIHTLVEPMHGSTSAEVVETYLSVPGATEEIFAGATAFMDSYGKFWAALNALIARDAPLARRVARETVV